jgi:hypothetical protein
LWPSPSVATHIKGTPMDKSITIVFGQIICPLSFGTNHYQFLGISAQKRCAQRSARHVVVMEFIEAWKDHPGWAHHRYDGHVIPWPKEEVLSWVPEREESDSLGKRHLEEPWKDMKRYGYICFP